MKKARKKWRRNLLRLIKYKVMVIVICFGHAVLLAHATVGVVSNKTKPVNLLEFMKVFQRQVEVLEYFFGIY